MLLCVCVASLTNTCVVSSVVCCVCLLFVCLWFIFPPRHNVSSREASSSNADTLRGAKRASSKNKWVQRAQMRMGTVVQQKCKSRVTIRRENMNDHGGGSKRGIACGLFIVLLFCLCWFAYKNNCVFRLLFVVFAFCLLALLFVVACVRVCFVVLLVLFVCMLFVGL